MFLNVNDTLTLDSKRVYWAHNYSQQKLTRKKINIHYGQ